VYHFAERLCGRERRGFLQQDYLFIFIYVVAREARNYCFYAEHIVLTAAQPTPLHSPPNLLRLITTERGKASIRCEYGRRRCVDVQNLFLAGYCRWARRVRRARQTERANSKTHDCNKRGPCKHVASLLVNVALMLARSEISFVRSKNLSAWVTCIDHMPS
jgi:hypothetical protein